MDNNTIDLNNDVNKYEGSYVEKPRNLPINLPINDEQILFEDGILVGNTFMNFCALYPNSMISVNIASEIYINDESMPKHIDKKMKYE